MATISGKYSPEAVAEISDGCSGGLSRFHNLLFGKDIACVYCCDEHDLAYYEGGSGQDRKLADIRLRQCVCASGEFGGLTAPLRRAWRVCLGWVMYLAVRLFGESHWGNG